MKKPIEIFGSTDPREMPKHLFWRAVHLDYKSAIRGNPQRQNYSVCPRHWYIDAVFKCSHCKKEYTWTARQQRLWFESYHFWIDSQPRLCKNCMATRKRLITLRKEYDSHVAGAKSKGTYDQKQRIVEIVRELERAFTSLPEKMIETRKLFEKQIQKAQQASAGNP